MSTAAEWIDRELQRLDREKVTAAQAEQIAGQVIDARDRAKLATLDRLAVLMAAAGGVASALHSFGVL